MVHRGSAESADVELCAIPAPLLLLKIRLQRDMALAAEAP